VSSSIHFQPNTLLLRKGGDHEKYSLIYTLIFFLHRERNHKRDQQSYTVVEE
jgi:hypothetical protein